MIIWTSHLHYQLYCKYLFKFWGTMFCNDYGCVICK